MKILHVLSYKDWGGGTASLENLFAEMSIKDKDLQQKFKKADYKVIMAPSAINLDPRSIFRLIQICRSEEIDLLHLHGPNVITTAFTEQTPSLQKKSVGKSIIPLHAKFSTTWIYSSLLTGRSVKG